MDKLSTGRSLGCDWCYARSLRRSRGALKRWDAGLSATHGRWESALGEGRRGEAWWVIGAAGTGAALGLRKRGPVGWQASLSGLSGLRRCPSAAEFPAACKRRSGHLLGRREQREGRQLSPACGGCRSFERR